MNERSVAEAEEDKDGPRWGKQDDGEQIIGGTCTLPAVASPPLCNSVSRNRRALHSAVPCGRQIYALC